MEIDGVMTEEDFTFSALSALAEGREKLIVNSVNTLEEIIGEYAGEADYEAKFKNEYVLATLHEHKFKINKKGVVYMQNADNNWKIVNCMADVGKIIEEKGYDERNTATEDNSS